MFLVTIYFEYHGLSCYRFFIGKFLLKWPENQDAAYNDICAHDCIITVYRLYLRILCICSPWVRMNHCNCNLFLPWQYSIPTRYSNRSILQYIILLRWRRLVQCTYLNPTLLSNRQDICLDFQSRQRRNETLNSISKKVLREFYNEEKFKNNTFESFVTFNEKTNLHFLGLTPNTIE